MKLLPLLSKKEVSDYFLKEASKACPSNAKIAWLNQYIQKGWLPGDEYTKAQFDAIKEQIKALLQNLLSPQVSLLPDWTKASGVQKTITPMDVGLCRQDGSSNISCITVPHDQNTTTYITQSEGVTIKNRVNSGGTTTITMKQN